MTELNWQHYTVTVKDPETNDEVVYPRIMAVSEPHAIRQAKDGYTGLLGPVDAIQDRLVVSATLNPSSGGR